MGLEVEAVLLIYQNPKTVLKNIIGIKSYKASRESIFLNFQQLQSLIFSLDSKNSFRFLFLVLNSTNGESFRFLIKNLPFWPKSIWRKTGEFLTKYRKMHLFDIVIPGEITFKESESFAAKSKMVIIDFKYFKIWC